MGFIRISMFTAFILTISLVTSLSYNHKNFEGIYHPLYRTTMLGDDCDGVPCVNLKSQDNEAIDENDFGKRATDITDLVQTKMHEEFPNGAIINVAESMKSEPGLFDYAQTCECIKEKKYLDLGSKTYPRYFIETKCRNPSCDYRMTCNEILFRMPLLKEKEADDIIDKHAPQPPESLREKYFFDYLDLSLGCECSVLPIKKFN